MLKLKLALLAFSILVFTACEKTVSSVEGPKEDPKLVITGIISPQDTMIIVKVDKSIPVFGVKQNQTQPPIPDARVVISEGNDSTILTYNSNEFWYEVSAATFPITAGKTYKLRVSLPDGMQAWAECTVPFQSPNSFSFSVDSARFISTFGDSVLEYSVKVDWTDVAGQENYYRTFGEIMKYVFGPFGTDSMYEPMYISSGGEELVDDENRDGQNITARGFNQHYHTNFQVPPANKVVVYLIYCDKNYFLYHESVFRGGAGASPFQEPVLIYTNVTNGLGVFAAYNTEKKELKL